MADKRQTLRPARDSVALVIGPLPPPAMGPAIGTQVIQGAFERLGVSVVHVDTSDRRNVLKTGVFDLRNVGLALVHTCLLTLRAARYPVRVAYVPISQGRWGYVRDAVLMTILRLFRRPIVVHLRGANLQKFFHSRGPLERWMIRRTLRWSVRAIALTPRLASVFDGLVAADRVRVLENAIPDPWPLGIEALQEARAKRATTGPQELRILFVANDFPSKGAATAVSALSHPGLERAVLRMVGEPSDALIRDTQELIRALGLEERVSLLGPLVGDEKWRQYEWADAFSYPSENDGQPLVVIEGMAAGLPIIASTCGGIPETTEATAILVPPRDDDALGKALASLVERPELRCQLGDAARERFVSRYTLDAFQERFAAVFGDLLDTDDATCAA
jgi:glycosyltransferase involved in cell wall biosynthesis